MNKALALVMTLALSPSLWAAQNTSVTNSAVVTNRRPIVLSIEPLWLVVGGIGAKADLAVSDRVSLGLQGYFVPLHNRETTDDSNTNETEYKWGAEEINLGPTFMLTGTTATSGAYIFPAIGYQRTRITDYSDEKLSGSFASPQLRLTGGYQWILPRAHMRLVAGGGLRLIRSNDIVIKDGSGKEVYRDKSSQLGALALDGAVGFTF